MKRSQILRDMAAIERIKRRYEQAMKTARSESYDHLFALVGALDRAYNAMSITEGTT